MNKKLSLLFLSFALSAMVFTSCGSGTDDNSNNGDDTSSVDNNGTKKNASFIFKSVPSTAELAVMIKNAGAIYDYKLLNDVKNKDKYSSTTAKAMNLGVYGADCSYASIFDQTNEMMFYIQCAQSLAGAIGASSAFDDATLDRVSQNKSNHDSVLSIMTDTYTVTDEVLSEGGRSGVSALVVAGGWIEGLYIATNLANTTKNNSEIVKRIAEQKNSLKNLIELLQENEETDGVKAIISGLKDIQAAYEKVDANTTAEVKNTDEKNKVTTLGGGTQMTLNKEQLAQISKLVLDLRTTITKP